MAIDANRIGNALRVLRFDEEGICRKGLFEEIFVMVRLSQAIAYENGEAKVLSRLEETIRWTNYISQDLWEIEALFDRLDWQRKLWEDGTLDEGRWMTHSTLDIDHFHLILRSTFDYIASLLRTVANVPGELGSATQTSFNDLRAKVSKKRSRMDEKLGADLAAFIDGCDWFEDVKAVRDSLAHFGGSTLTFPIKPRILFQTHSGKDLSNTVTFFPEVMYNEYVVDFELYAGLIYAYLLDFLQRLAELVVSRLRLTKPDEVTSRSYHYGMRVAIQWIDLVMSHAEVVSQGRAEWQVAERLGYW